MNSRRQFVSAGLAALLSVESSSRTVFAAQQPNSNYPSAATSDWNLASPESEGFSMSALDKVLDDAETLGVMRSLLVVRRGNLVAERYYGGAAMSDLLAVNSVTKSVSSMLVGIALQQRRIANLSSTVGTLLPDAAAKFPASPANSITLTQVLTGTSGLVYDNRTQRQFLASASDPVRFTLDLPFVPQTPATWGYNDAAVSLLSPVLERAEGMAIDEFAKRYLFSQLGIQRFDWKRDKAGRCMSYMGLKLRPRDLAKIAWVMTDAGQWRGEQVLPVGWVNETVQARVRPSWQVAPISDIGYGYLWFTGSLNGRRVAWAWGYGAQFAMVVPSLHLAIVTLASDPRPQDLAKQNASVMGLVARVIELAS